ncbi:LysR family transcriptional regulator [Chondromyces crocatus]|uniref:LysR family transcriptional regulator n=1 Tax=Chondromyces crocatus TaxID=52 RepID=A0A0K1EFJ7_CHOCO|nr:LysR family transcriptional regulator [Chondromyces crocatus]AKT39635.1 LysR family transcriptional regulator [Chondromyces crocatus]
MIASLDELLAMATFARVVEHKSFTGAATTLGLSKSVVSARVSALEGRLGVRLIHRTTRRLTLTEEGARLYGRCVHFLAAADEAASALHGASQIPEGTLRVSVPVGFGMMQLAPLLGEFAARCPKVRLELSLSDRPVDMVADGFDVGVRFAQKLEEPSVARKIGVDRRVICGSRAYLERHGVPESPNDLPKHNCLRLALRRAEWTFEKGAESLPVPVTGNLVVDNIVVLRQAVLDGLGLAMMPCSVVGPDLAAGRLQAVLASYSLEELSIFVVYPYVGQQPAKVRAFVDWLTPKVGEVPGVVPKPRSSRKRRG